MLTLIENKLKNFSKSRMKNKDNKDKYDIGIAFLTLSNKYLILVKNILEETIKQGNIWILTKNKKKKEEKTDYNKETKWSDFNIIIPTLFNFYHGIELLLKGFLILKIELKTTHKITQLFKQFEDNYKENLGISNILRKYIDIDNKITPTILKSMIKRNNNEKKNNKKITSDNLYEFLRYPTVRNIKNTDAKDIRNYFDLQYKGNNGLKFFEELKNDTDILITKSIKLHKEI